MRVAPFPPEAGHGRHRPAFAVLTARVTKFVRNSVVAGACLLAGLSAAHAGPNGERYAAIAIDGNTGEVVFARNADDLRYPASLTKIMTLYLMFEAVEQGRFTLDSKLPVSAYAAGRPPSKIGVRAGQTIRVEDAILSLVTKSANDVSVVIAEAIAGNVEEFAKMMNARAQSIGMTRTTFQNPHGLPNRAQVTTARDMAVLGRSIQWRFPEFYKYFATRNFRYRGTNYRNHNRLLGRVAGVDGIKTGFIRASGFNLVANMVRNRRHVVAVVMGGRSGASRNAEMERVLGLAYKRVKPFDQPLVASSPRPLSLATLPLPRPNPLAANVVATVPGATRLQPTSPTQRLFVDPATGGLQIARAQPVSKPAVLPAQPPQPRAAPQQVVAQATGQTAPAQFGSIEELTRAISANSAAMPASPAVQALAPAAPAANVPVPTVPVPAAPVQTASVATPPTTTAQAAPRSIDDLLTASVSTTRITVPSRVITSDGRLLTPPMPAAQPAQIAAQPVPAVAPAQPVQAAVIAPAAPPAPAPAAPPPSGWFIQIGAYNDEASALSRMDSARRVAERWLSDAAPYTETVDKNGRTLWRARFAGLERAAARAACDHLKSRDFGCFAQEL